MNITLTQMLELVGKLDDTPGDDTPRSLSDWDLGPYSMPVRNFFENSVTASLGLFER